MTATIAENEENVTKAKLTKVSYFDLYRRYASGWDYVLIAIGIIMAMLKSLVHPLCIIVYSELASLFIDRTIGIGTSSSAYTLTLFGGGKTLTNATHAENMAEMKNDSAAFGIFLTILTAIMFLSGIATVDLFNHVALNMIVRMRRRFFEATIRKDIAWHDTAKDQNFAVRITDNMEKIRQGVAENCGHFVYLMCSILSSLVISFIYGWKLTLVIFISIPITILTNFISSICQSKLSVREQTSYVRAGNIAEEVFGAIRTVVAFGGEKSESERYDSRLVPARKSGAIRGIFSGLNDSILKATMFISCAVAFWYGADLIIADFDKPNPDREYTPAILMIVVFGIVVSVDNISRITPFLETFATACSSAAAIFEVIDSSSSIDPLASDGKVLNYGLKGDISFADVFFCYPARKDAIVLRGINLSIKSGETVALVGHSGSGKSTVIQLLQRFYDPIFGKIMLDGLDITKYNISWLRSNIAVVGQEPVLFHGTIGENICHGKPGATQREVEEAAKAAGAHDFIVSLPKSYKTHISEKGVQLSGGQRQRIAIARALIQNPKILLLDEATSALDYHNEKLVQAALNRASKGRTTIVVSHRLSAICNADRIIYIEKGKIIEEGTHDELAKLNGKYAAMLSAHAYEDDADELLNDEVENEEDLEHLKNAERKLSNDLRYSKKYSNGYQEGLCDNGFRDKNIFTISGNKETLENEEKQSDEANFTQTFLRIVQWAKPEWCFLSIATICAGIYGLTQPAFCFVLAELYGSLSTIDIDEILQNTSVIAIVSICIGLVTAVACFTQSYFFNLGGVWLTTRMRSITFKSIMQQDMAWFDEKENSVGALSARLAGDASSVQGAIGFPLSNIIQSVTNFICSFSIAFYYSWELALICLCSSPFMVASIVFEAKYSTKSAIREKEVLDETSRVATEAVAEIRTVAALRREKELIAQYNGEVENYRVQLKQRLRFRGLVNSLGMSIMFFGYAITLTYGGYMCADEKIRFEDVMKISNTMLYGLFILAHSLAFTPAFNAAIVSANRLFSIIYRTPTILSPPDCGAEGVAIKQNGYYSAKTNVVQGVNFRDIHFAYPTRREQRVLRGFQLDVPQGKTIALVGPSGAGKSTCVQLLQRYYDPDAGKILINQDDIHQDLGLPCLRRRLGIVSQEPSLFEKTIAENIAYGDTTRVVTMHEIMEAAKNANAHDFISALPQGYDTMLGAKGTQLSGGQKQRIAIARALVRNPQILLLDEATSALDLQSERIVQAALDKACSGRTSIVIAHRLTTVQKADLICVMQAGRIVEKGTHQQLLAKNGIYAKLYRTQPKSD